MDLRTTSVKKKKFLLQLGAKGLLFSVIIYSSWTRFHKELIVLSNAFLKITILPSHPYYSLSC